MQDSSLLLQKSFGVWLAGLDGKPNSLASPSDTKQPFMRRDCNGLTEMKLGLLVAILGRLEAVIGRLTMYSTEYFRYSHRRVDDTVL